MRLLKSQPSAETLAYVVMPDHLHWLMQLKADYDLSGVMRFVKSETTRRSKALQDLSAPIWQRGFYDQAIRAEEDIIDYTRYIVANPSTRRDREICQRVFVVGRQVDLIKASRSESTPTQIDAAVGAHSVSDMGHKECYRFKYSLKSILPAESTAWMRLCTPSLRSMADTWALTVVSAIFRL